MPSEAVLRNAENNALSNAEPSFYRGTGKSNFSNKNIQTKGKKKKGGIFAFVFVFGLIIGGCTFLASSHSLLGPAISALFIETGDTGYTSYAARSARLAAFKLQGGSGVTSTWKGTLKYSRMSENFRARLTSQGFTVNGSGANTTLTFRGETYDADGFLNAYYNNPELRSAYKTAKRGRVANFFDQAFQRIAHKLGLSRNLYKDYKNSNNSTVDAENSNKIIDDKIDTANGDADLTTTHDEKPEATEDNPDPNPETDPETSTKQNVDGDTPETKASNYINRIASKVQKSVSYACTALGVFNILSNAVTAARTYQNIQLAMGLNENVSKTMAGYGNEAGLNTMLNSFTTTTTNTVEDYNNISYSGSVPSSEMEAGNLTINQPGTVTYTGAATEATAFQSIMAGATLDPLEANNFSLGRESSIMDRVLKFATSPTPMATCINLTLATSAASLIISLIPGSGVVQIAGTFFLKAAAGVVASFALGSILGFMIPTIARTFFTPSNIANLTGIPLGNTYSNGTIATLTRNGRSGSGQSYSSEKAAQAYHQETQRVLALDAEIDRMELSPFDTSSRHTFLGSIAYSFLPITFSKQTSNINTIMRNTSKAIASLTGNTYAASNNYMTTFGNCPDLARVGAVGDVFCNPITTTDLSLVDISPDDPSYVDAIKSEVHDCDDNGNCKIKDNSDLAKYISYCANRDSPIGIVDANILNELRSGNAVTNFFSAWPKIGDLLSFIGATEDITNMNWATGKNCVNNTDTNPEWNSKYRYYQRYVEDERILAQMSGEPSTISQYLDKYEAEHPLDTSPKGTLARISGLSPEDAELALDVIAYYNFLDHYDASSRLAMTGDTTDYKNSTTIVSEITSEKIHFDEDTKLTPVKLITEHIIYTDVRNRSYVA